VCARGTVVLRRVVVAVLAVTPPFARPPSFWLSISTRFLSPRSGRGGCCGRIDHPQSTREHRWGGVVGSSWASLSSPLLVVVVPVSPPRPVSSWSPSLSLLSLSCPGPGSPIVVVLRHCPPSLSSTHDPPCEQGLAAVCGRYWVSFVIPFGLVAALPFSRRLVAHVPTPRAVACSGSWGCFHGPVSGRCRRPGVVRCYKSKPIRNEKYK
jgi:hypothetical protein